MRINKFVALASGMSRRSADAAVAAGRIQVNGIPGATGQTITETDIVLLDGRPLHAPAILQTILLHKPAGFVVSRDGQGSRTIYDLLPSGLRHLKPIGRLDKDSSGLLLLTNDGQLAEQLTHPGNEKTKIYEIVLDKPLTPQHHRQIEQGIALDDGPSRLLLEPLNTLHTAWRVRMHEGRNRQVRRTFAALHYDVTKLHRTQFGPYRLDAKLSSGSYTPV